MDIITCQQKAVEDKAFSTGRFQLVFDGTANVVECQWLDAKVGLFYPRLGDGFIFWKTSDIMDLKDISVKNYRPDFGHLESLLPP